MEELNERVLNAALAGLLHDVGKFAQRAGVGLSESWNDEARRDYGYQHALASYGFLRRFVPEGWRADLRGAAYHHRPQTLEDRWVQIADWLSATEREGDEDTHAPTLQTIFTRVDDFKTAAFWPLEQLQYSNEKALFGQGGEKPEWNEGHRQNYVKLWGEFEVECQARGLTAQTRLSKQAYLETLLAVLQKFTWCVPSAYWQAVPDVALFDHLRTTAALAACLAADGRDEAWCRTTWEAMRTQMPGGEIALFVAADVSGLQDFLYTLSSSGAAKSLRARSFYLQWLGEIIALSLLDALQLPVSNLLYVGGGGFQLLAPVKAEAALPGLEQALTDKLLQAHRGALGLTLVWRRVAAHEFAAFNQVREAVGRALNRKKRQPFAQASTRALAEHIGRPITSGGDPLRFCRVTGDDWDVREDKKAGTYKTGFVLSLEKLGLQLPRATHMVLSTDVLPVADRPHDWQEALALFGYHAEVVTSQVGSLGDKPRGLIRVYRLEENDIGQEKRWVAELQRQSQVALAERPLAKLTPFDKEGEVLTFDDLAGVAQGIKRWGVLRMDVDNLGKIFQTKLGSNASLSRVASLSFGLRVFFEGWLPQLARPAEGHSDDLSDRLYLQYSGGDDVFVVGAWDALPEFALRVRESFRKFTGGNPAFTLSGGIATVEAKYPLYQAARLAGEAEDKAKAFIDEESHKEKDAITFLDHTCDWQTFEEICRNARQLAEWSRQRLVPKALLQVVLALYLQTRLARQAAARAGKPKPQYGRWMWMAAYQLSRMARDARAGAQNGINRIQDVFVKPGAEVEHWGLAARWAQYLSRGGK